MTFFSTSYIANSPRLFIFLPISIPRMIVCIKPVKTIIAVGRRIKIWRASDVDLYLWVRPSFMNPYNDPQMVPKISMMSVLLLWIGSEQMILICKNSKDKIDCTDKYMHSILSEKSVNLQITLSTQKNYIHRMIFQYILCCKFLKFHKPFCHFLDNLDNTIVSSSSHSDDDDKNKQTAREYISNLMTQYIFLPERAFGVQFLYQFIDY